MALFAYFLDTVAAPTAAALRAHVTYLRALGSQGIFGVTLYELHEIDRVEPSSATW